MAWLQLHFDTRCEHVERLSDFLVSAHAISVTWQAGDAQDLFEPPLDSTPLWQNVKISALFADDTPLRPLIDALQAEFDEKVIFDTEAVYVKVAAFDNYKEYSDDIISKCLDLIEAEYQIAKKPVHESDFILDPMYSKAEHYRVGRQNGINICRKVIKEYFGGNNG